MNNVQSIRELFRIRHADENFVIDKTGVKTIELMGTSFTANEPSIYGKLSEEYIKRELAWYASQSLYVTDIKEPVPQIWKDVSSKHGRINSNYGWCIYSQENGHQFDQVISELLDNPNSRRAIMIYNRPSMHEDYNTDDMNDFMCTNTVQYLLRDNLLHAVVNMRSNDVVFGYKNDYAWQKYVLDDMCDILTLRKSVADPILCGSITWQVGSLHMYERHFHLIKEHTDAEYAKAIQILQARKKERCD